jgi:hypothetical protein
MSPEVTRLLLRWWWRRQLRLSVTGRRPRIQIQAFGKPESDDCFGWVGDVAIVSRRTRAYGSGTGADQSSNQRAFTAACQAAD